MLTKTLVTITVIVALFVIACVRETRRERSLREWASRHPGRRLLWPFERAEHPEIPLLQLFESLIGCQPLALASGVLVNRGEGDVWWVEYRSSLSAGRSSQWFTLEVRHCRDQAATLRCEEELKRAAPNAMTRTHESWVCQRHDGVMTVKLLEASLSRPI